MPLQRLRDSVTLISTFVLLYYCITLYHEHTNVWLTVHFLLRDLLHGTLYWSNFVAHALTARFVAILTHFYFLNFIPSDIVVYSLHFSLAYFYC